MAEVRIKKKENRFAVSFTLRFDAFTLEMLERMAYDEDKTRPEIIRSAVKLLFQKKYDKEELAKLREKHNAKNFSSSETDDYPL